MIQTSIFDNQIYFGITFQGQTELIIEPMMFEKIQNRIPRDPKWLGFWSDFLEDKYGMKFTFLVDDVLNLVGGGQILKNIYETIGFGPNSKVFFEIGYKKVNTLERVNQWRINLNEYDCVNYGSDKGYVQTSIEKLPLQGKLRSRMNSSCTINGFDTMDGEILTPISTWLTRMHSKTLLETTRCLSPTLQLSNEVFDNGGSIFNMLIQPDQSQLSPNELEDVFTQPVGLINTTTRTNTGDVDAVLGLPFTDLICNYQPRTSGYLSIKWSGSTNIIWYNGVPPTTLLRMNMTITPRIVVQRMIGGVATIISIVNGTPVNYTLPTVGVYAGGAGYAINTSGLAYLLPSLTTSLARSQCNIIQNHTWDEDVAFRDIRVNSGDLIYVQLFIPSDDTTNIPFTEYGLVFGMQLDKFTNDITYKQLTSTPATQSNTYRIFDVITQMLENLTGQKNALISRFFAKSGTYSGDVRPYDGYGYEYVVTNGYSIRNFGSNVFLPKKTLEEFLSDLQSIFFLAIGMKKIDNVEYMEIEYAPKFFETRTIDIFDETFEWHDKHSHNLCFNKAELGYDKFEGLNIIQNDEFATQGSYLTQNLVYGNTTLSKRSKTIASGYLIEEQRRHQFDNNPGQTLTNDEDLFIDAVSPNPLIWNIPEIEFFHSLTQPDGQIVAAIFFQVGSMALMIGDTIKVISSTGGSGANIGTVFTIVSEISGYPVIGNDAYVVTPAPTSDFTFINVVSISASSPNIIFSERSESFEICTGVIDPSTIYNGRLSLKHILYNWRPLIGVGLYFVDPLSNDYAVTRIIPTLIRMNSVFTSKFYPSEIYKGNASTLTLVENKREVIKDYLATGENLFTPIGATCKIKCGWNRMDVIRKALSGELSDDTKDHGGLVLIDSFGIYWFCHVMDIQYNLVSEIATLEVQKVKRVVL